MKTWKKRLAMFLAVVLLLGTVPVAALEEDLSPPPASVSHETDGEQPEPTAPDAEESQEALPEISEELPEVIPDTPDELPEAVPDVLELLEDAVVYNLGTYNTAVLPAALETALEDETVSEAVGAFMLETDCRDLLFLDEEGGFAIPLPESEPFFPYPVQFQSGGETWTEWFDEADSAAAVGGAVFTLTLREGAEPLYIEGPEDEVRAWLAKDFTTDGDPAQAMSLQPLTNGYAAVYFTKKELEGPFTLKSLAAMALKGNSYPNILTVGDDTVVVWQAYIYEGNSYDPPSESNYKSNGRYTIGKGSDTMDLEAILQELRGEYEYYTSLNLELIVGKTGHDNSDQNDGEKYRIRLSIQIGNHFLACKAYDETNASLSQYISGYVEETFYDGETYQPISKNCCNIQVYGSEWSGSERTTLKFGWDEQLKQVVDAAGESAEVKIYTGYYETEIPANAADVTSQLLMERKNSYSTEDWDNFAGYSVQLSSLSDWGSWDKVPKFTLALVKNGSAEVLLPFAVRISPNYAHIYFGDSLYSKIGDFGFIPVAESIRENYEYTGSYRMLNRTLPTNGRYYFQMTFYSPMPGESVSNYVASVTAGGAALTPGQISDLFSGIYNGGGYCADFSQGVTFTITYTNKYHYNPGGKETFTVKTLPSNEEPGNVEINYDTFFVMNGAAKSGSNGSYRSYVMQAKDDGYYKYGYQTLFLANGDNPVSDETIVPQFTTRALSLQAKTEEDESASNQDLTSTTAIPFTDGRPVQYTAYVDNSSSTHRNYWVTFATKTAGGPKLFVNGATNADAAHRDSDGNLTRLVVLDDARNYHDVFVANLGDAPMNGLYARLEDAQNVKLDPYWSFRENSSLAEFPSYFISSYDGFQQNISKVRLLPEVDEATGLLKGGLIGGTLIIGYTKEDGTTEEVRIKLIGFAGNLQFTNQSLRKGVKWVPYVTAIQDNTLIDTEHYEFTVTGTLPSGLSWTPAGEIYGVPQEYGNFPIHVKLEYKGSIDTLLGGVGDLLSEEEKAALQDRLSCEGDLTLTILNNTDVNVWTVPTDESYSYAVETPVGTDQGNYHFTIDSYTDRVFKSAGPFGDFVNFYLDGRLLVRDTDYAAEDGSTIITIKEQTFRNAGPGTHTIAAEFFPGGSRTDANTRSMKTTSQNYTLTIGGSSGSGSSGGSSGGGSGGSSGGGGSRPSSSSSKPTASTKPAAPETPPVPSFPFTDVPQDNVFRADIQWVFDNGLMIGTTDSTFEPRSTLTAAAIITVLARMAKVDLTQYEHVADEEIDPSAWYAAAAIWAKHSGLLPEEGAAIFQAPLKREQMAVMLVKYLRLVNVEPQPPEEPVIFADADRMSPEGNAAFQTLYQYGIFKGTGNGVMDPGGITNRGQFAALIHRISDRFSLSGDGRQGT